MPPACSKMSGRQFRADGLIITVIENPVINRIAFEGNKKVKDEQLKTEIQSKERGTLSRPVVQADVARLVEVYRRSGRFDIHVEPKIIELPNNRVDLVFEISEGAKTGVKLIQFIGNRSYSSLPAQGRDQDLRDRTACRSCRPATSTIRTGSKPIASCCAGSISSTASSTCASSPRVGEYRSCAAGFRGHFHHRGGRAVPRSERRRADRPFAGSIPALLRPKLRTYPGDVYNAEAVEKTVEEMTIEAARQGFAFATVRPRAIARQSNRLVNLVFHGR